MALQPSAQAGPSRLPEIGLWPCGTGHLLCLDTMATSAMMEQLRLQIDSRYRTESRKDATVIVLDPSHPYSALLALHLQTLGKPVVSVHWASSSWNENVTLPMDNYLLVPQQHEQEEQRRPQAERPEGPASAEPAGVRVASLEAANESWDDTDVKPDVNGPDEKPVSDPEPVEAERRSVSSELTDIPDEDVKPPQSPQSGDVPQGARRSSRERTGFSDAGMSDAVVGSDRNSSEPGIPQPRSAAGRAAVALAAAQRDLNQRIASGDVDAASEWQSLAPEVNLQTFGGERLREVALALSLNDGMFALPQAPKYKADDDGFRFGNHNGKSTKRDDLVVAHYRARIDVDADAVDKADQVDAAEQMVALALGRTCGGIEPKIRYPKKYPAQELWYAAATAHHRQKHRATLRPIPTASFIKRGTPLTSEEHALLAEMFVRFTFKTAEAFIMEGFWVLGQTRRYNEIFNAWNKLCQQKIDQRDEQREAGPTPSPAPERERGLRSRTRSVFAKEEDGEEAEDDSEPSRKKVKVSDSP